MSTWIEIRCERRGQSAPEPRCWSNRNDGPMGMAGDANADALSMVRSLRKDAKKAGWVKTKDGWVCPVCATSL